MDPLGLRLLDLSCRPSQGDGHRQPKPSHALRSCLFVLSWKVLLLWRHESFDYEGGRLHELCLGLLGLMVKKQETCCPSLPLPGIIVNIRVILG